MDRRDFITKTAAMSAAAMTIGAMGSFSKIQELDRMVKIQAHRGASKERPENTMSAFRRALELGADGIELDLHLIKDGSLPVHHDGNLGRCESVEGSLYAMTRDQLTFSVGEKFSPSYKDELIPDFSEVLAFLQDNQLFLNAEIKADHPFIADHANRTVALLDQYNMRDRCLISSFNHYILKDIKERYPQYQVGALYGQAYGQDVTAYCQRYRFDAVHPSFQDVDKAMVERCHDHGILVNVWTVDKPEDIERMVSYGVDAIITNDVATARAVIG